MTDTGYNKKRVSLLYLNSNFIIVILQTDKDLFAPILSPLSKPIAGDMFLQSYAAALICELYRVKCRTCSLPVKYPKKLFCLTTYSIVLVKVGLQLADSE